MMKVFPEYDRGNIEPTIDEIVKMLRYIMERTDFAINDLIKRIEEIEG